MHYITPLLICIFSLFVTTSCNEEDPLDAETRELISTLRQEIVPLDAEPLNWSDEDLSFLNPVADKSIIALGESTHGTAEFFNAKKRIFQYLVENHNYKVFAFEADFGESLFINEAVQEGRDDLIPRLMSEKMHFWTWKNQQVRNLLEWMSRYNQDKTPEERVHYVGVDCQFNTYHPDLLNEYLENAQVPFADFAETVLDEAKVNTITTVVMEVPCCGGLVQMVQTAVNQATRKVQVKVVVISTRGEILSEEWALPSAAQMSQ